MESCRVQLISLSSSVAGGIAHVLIGKVGQTFSRVTAYNMDKAV